MQNWFGYSDPAMEEALYETTILRQFSGLSLERIPDETTILNFRHLQERHELAAGILGVINGYLGDRGLSLRLGEKHCSEGDAVRPVEPVDGASTFALQRRRGAPLMREIAAARLVQRQKWMK